MAGQRPRQRRLEAPVDLDRVHVGAALGEARRQRADARADLERDVPGPERREPLDDAEHVVVDEEVLPQLAIGPQAELGQAGERDLTRRAHSQREDARGVRLDLLAELAGVDAAQLGDRAQRLEHVVRAVRLAAVGHGREVGAVGLEQQQLGRHAPRGLGERRSPTGR